MTHPDAGTPRPIDARQVDALNRYIDGLIHGIDRPTPDLDPRLVAAVRTIHGGDPTAAGSDPDRADEDRLWRDLMQLRPRPELRALPRGGSATVLPPLTADAEGPLGDVRIGKQRPQGRARHIGGRTLGLVATLTLVALLTLSGLAVYLNAPDGTAPPTSIAGIGATTSVHLPAVAVAGTPASGATPGSVPNDLERPTYQTCNVTPRTMDDAISTLVRPYELPATKDGRMAVPGRLISWEQVSEQGYARSPDGMPAGTSVDPAVIAQITSLYGTWLGCSLETNVYSLTSTALLSDDGLLRLFWNFDDREPNGYLILRLGSPGPVALEDRRGQIGQSGRDYLWGFRMLSDGRVAAFLAREVSGIAENYDDYPVFAEDRASYVVFLQTIQGWQIDELSLPGPA